MTDKEYGPHEPWCDTQNNISELCNCMACGYIEKIEALNKVVEVVREALEYYTKQGFFNSYDELRKENDYGHRAYVALAKAKEILK